MSIPRFRRLVRTIGTGWMRNPDFDGERVLFSIGKLCDAFAEKTLRGLEARFPGRAPASANRLTGGDRGILLGRSETNEDFAARLRAWRLPRTHRVRGNAYELLLQVWHYWGGVYAATIDSHGLRHVIEADDEPDVDTLANPTVLPTWVSGGATQWDGAVADTHWSRFWLVVQPPTSMGIVASPDFGDADLWGGAVGTPGYLLGQVGATLDDVTAMRALFQELKWNPAHTQPEWLVLSLDTSTPVPDPDTNWQYWSKDDAGTRVASRVPPALTFTHGTAFFQNGAAAGNVALPATVEEGDLLIWCESQANGTFSVAPSGWTTIETNLTAGAFQVSRVLARLGQAGEGGSTVVYTPTGADDHAVRITAVSPPAAGWSATVADNFSEIATTTSAPGSVTVDLPDNADEQHRLAFVSFDYFDDAINVSSVKYSELYDSANEINISLFSKVGKTTGATVVAASGSPSCQIISFRLVYNLAWRFWSLAPEYNNTYGGDRGREWPAAATNVDGSGTYAGDRTNGATAFSLQAVPWVNDHTGFPFIVGSRTRFPTSVLLLDDGSPAK